MNNNSDTGKVSAGSPSPSEAEVRKKRLAKTLKANLKRRKSQARQRRADETTNNHAAKDISALTDRS